MKLTAKSRAIENKPDTSGVVGRAQSHNAAMGRMSGPANRNKPSHNGMVAGNANRKTK